MPTHTPFLYLHSSFSLIPCCLPFLLLAHALASADTELEDPCIQYDSRSLTISPQNALQGSWRLQALCLGKKLITYDAASSLKENIVISEGFAVLSWTSRQVFPNYPLQIQSHQVTLILLQKQPFSKMFPATVTRPGSQEIWLFCGCFFGGWHYILPTLFPNPTAWHTIITKLQYVRGKLRRKENIEEWPDEKEWIRKRKGKEKKDNVKQWAPNSGFLLHFHLHNFIFIKLCFYIELM